MKLKLITIGEQVLKQKNRYIKFSSKHSCFVQKPPHCIINGKVIGYGNGFYVCHSGASPITLAGGKELAREAGNFTILYTFTNITFLGKCHKNIDLEIDNNKSCVPKV